MKKIAITIEPRHEKNAYVAKSKKECVYKTCPIAQAFKEKGAVVHVTRSHLYAGDDPSVLDQTTIGWLCEDAQKLVRRFDSRLPLKLPQTVHFRVEYKSKEQKPLVGKFNSHLTNLYMAFE